MLTLYWRERIDVNVEVQAHTRNHLFRIRDMEGSGRPGNSATMSRLQDAEQAGIALLVQHIVIVTELR